MLRAIRHPLGAAPILPRLDAPFAASDYRAPAPTLPTANPKKSRRLDLTRPAVLVIGPYPPGEIELLEAACDVHRLWEAPDKAALLRAHGSNIRAVATRGDLGVSGELIAALPKLEMIGVYGVGVDGVDLAAARARGIKVSNTPDVLTGETADIALALMLAVVRDCLLYTSPSPRD